MTFPQSGRASSVGGVPHGSLLPAVDRWWRAANYLSVGQIYLRDNPLLARPLDIGDIKPRLLGHWGTTPGLNLIWAHVNRMIVERGWRTLFVCGPGHGGPAAIANPWLEGTYGERYPMVGWSEPGLRRLFAQFSSPGGVPSHAAPETPGSIHEGGELGYALAHAYGAAFDAAGEIVVCVVGDGEAETGPTAAGWHSHRFLDPRRDGVVLPILHLNGYKIANPTLLARMPESQLVSLLRGYGHEPWLVGGDDPALVHAQLAKALDQIADRLDEIRAGGFRQDIEWPMIVLRTPKGWTGPDEIDGQVIEGHHRSHQVPVDHDLGADRLCRELEQWLRSYGPDQLFTADGAPSAALASLRPEGDLRMSATPRANAGVMARPLELPELGDVAVDPTAGDASAMAALGGYLRGVMERNPDHFRLFAPDEISSNRLDAVFDATVRAWSSETQADDEALGPGGRVLEVLSEHLCQGWLEGYVLTGRHGIFSSYEAFVHVVDSMFNQHAKWLESASEVEWRAPIPSLNYLLSSHVWRQDHNGFTHQDPGFLDVVANKRVDIVRLLLPPDANCLLATTDQALRSQGLINVIVAGKQDEPQYLDLAEASDHCQAGLGRWDWAGNDDGCDPEVVVACAGDVPTMESLAAADLLRSRTDVSVRVVNVVDLLRLQSPRHNPRGLSDGDYLELFPSTVPTIFAFHGYPWLVHRLVYDRPNHSRLHVHGYRERGSTTTPFDMVVRNQLDRFHLVLAVLDRLGADRQAATRGLRRHAEDMLVEHTHHVREAGTDLDAVSCWRPSRP